MTVASEMGRIERLDELLAFLVQHGMEFWMARHESGNCIATLRIMRDHGKIECNGKGDTLIAALRDAARNIDRMLAI